MQLMKDDQGKVRTPALLALIALLHGAIIGSVLVLQGCGTTRARQGETADAPPAPVMPPSPMAEQGTAPVTPRPVFQPPVAVESAPSGVEAAGGQTYAIQKGDSLSKIAYRYGVSAREIAELNNIKDPNKIRIGQKILLPAYARSEPLPKPAKKASAPATKPTAKASAAGGGDYVVKAGDSLSKIASRQGTTVKALRESNNLKGDMIRVGQKLVIPGAGKQASEASAPAPAAVPPPVPVPPAEATPALAPAPAPAPADAPASADVPFEYQLKPGETLDDVARNFAVLKQDLMSLNNITDESQVQPSQKIKIPLGNP
jgi:LysM repeat protein